MNSAPWWATPLFTLGGVLMTLLVTVWLDRRKGQRESAFRWTEHKMGLYSDYLKACNDLLGAQVWPPDRTQPAQPTAPLLDHIRRASAEIAFVAPASVTQRVNTTVTTAQHLAANIDQIRATSKPGHGARIDDRFQADHDKARTEFAADVGDFLAAARIDVDITTPYSGPYLTGGETPSR